MSFVRCYCDDDSFISPTKGRRRSSGYKIVADDKDRTRFRFVEVSESSSEESEL